MSRRRRDRSQFRSPGGSLRAAAAALILAWAALAVPAASLRAAEPTDRAPAHSEGAEQVPPSGGARRIVSLVPSVTETIFALGEASRLVAVSSFCDYPPEARAIPRAGSYLSPSVETIIALQPDAVIGVPTPGNRPAIEALRALGLNVVLVGETTLADAWDSIRTIGKWVDRPREAEALVQRLQGELAQVRAQHAGEARPRVLFVVGHDPLVAAGSGLFIDELIDVAGGDNVMKGAAQRWPRLSVETVVAAAPDVIIDGAMGSEAGGALRAYWETYRSVPAVRDDRVRAQSSDALLRPGPRLGQAARELEALIWQGQKQAAS